MFVHVLDHDDGAIDHRPDRNRNPPEGHNIGVDSLPVHDNKGRQNANRQAENRHQRRANVEQKDDAHQAHHQKLFKQLEPEIIHRPLNQTGAIINRYHLDTFRQTGFQFLQFRLHAIDGCLGVFTEAHHYYATDGLAFAIQLSHPAPHLRPNLNSGHVFQEHGGAVVIKPQRNRQQVLTGLDVAGRAHHVFRLGHLDDRGAHFLIAPLDGVLDMSQRNSQRPELFRADLDLILLHHATKRGHFGHAWHCLEFVFQKPVLQAAQLAQIVVPGAIHQSVEVNPANPGCVRPQLRAGRVRKARGHLGQVLQHPGASPVHVGVFIEDHIDVGVPKEGVTPDRLGTRHRQHGGGQWIGHLVFHHLWCLARKAGFDNDLHIRKIRQRIYRRLAQRVEAKPCNKQGGQQYQKSITNRPVNDGCDHDSPPP